MTKLNHYGKTFCGASILLSQFWIILVFVLNLHSQFHYSSFSSWFCVAGNHIRSGTRRGAKISFSTSSLARVNSSVTTQVYCSQTVRWIRSTAHSTSFFSNGGSWESQYGYFFLSGIRLFSSHADCFFSAASSVFSGSGVSLCWKFPLLHQWHKLGSQSFELTVGF